MYSLPEFFFYIRERKGRQIGKRGSDLQDQEGQDGQRGGQNIVDKMIRNTEAGKHWLKEEERAVIPVMTRILKAVKLGKSLQGKKARFQTQMKILMNLIAVVKLNSIQVKLKFAVQNTLVPSEK